MKTIDEIRAMIQNSLIDDVRTARQAIVEILEHLATLNSAAATWKRTANLVAELTADHDFQLHRDQFAAAAIAVMITADFDPADIARQAYQVADAMIARRSGKPLLTAWDIELTAWDIELTAWDIELTAWDIERENRIRATQTPHRFRPSNLPQLDGYCAVCQLKYAAPIHDQRIDYTKPHKFDYSKDKGLSHTHYPVCKCGFSELAPIHIKENRHGEKEEGTDKEGDANQGTANQGTA